MANENQTEIVYIRVTKELKEDIAQAAKNDGRTFSGMAARILTCYINDLKAADQETNNTAL